MSVNRTIPHLVLTFILATVQLACGTIVHAQAADDGVEWRPIHEGGNEWIVTPCLASITFFIRRQLFFSFSTRVKAGHGDLVAIAV